MSALKNLFEKVSSLFSAKAESEPRMHPIESPRNLDNANDFITPLCTVHMDTEEYERLRNQERSANINELSKEDIERLRETDAFMYFSIPESQRTGYRRSIAEPPGKRRSRSISRRTVISVEAHPNLALEELLNIDYDDQNEAAFPPTEDSSN